MSRDTLHGRPTESDHPHWRPLIDLVGEELVADFMWMLEILLEDDSMLQAYKHIPSRRYLHLHDDGGRAFVCVARGRYRELHPRVALEAVFGEWQVDIAGDDDFGPIRSAIVTAYDRADRFATSVGEA
jgi:hypothetical protein